MKMHTAAKKEMSLLSGTMLSPRYQECCSSVSS